MKFWTLMENNALQPELVGEHGLSLYLETCGKRILFDAGQTDAFADNAAQLGVDLQQVDLAILSHGHYDHSGGLSRFLQINSSAPVYVSPYAFEGHYNAAGKDIGVDPALEGSNRLIRTGELCSLGDGLTIYGCNDNEIVYPADPFGLSMQSDHGPVPEDFRHEQYLLVEEGEKRILISGCSHKGILNLVHWFRPHVLIGGFHFMKLDPDGEDRETLEQAAEILLSYPTMYYTGHCTGEPQFHFLKERMGDRLQQIHSGSCIEV